MMESGEVSAVRRESFEVQSYSRSPKTDQKWIVIGLLVLLGVFIIVISVAVVATQRSSGKLKNDSDNINGQSISVKISLLEVQCEVASAEALVQAPDMEPIGPIPLQIDDDAITGRIDNVPTGVNRQIVVRVLNSAEEIVYRGQATVDVTNNDVSDAMLTLGRDYNNCPGNSTDVRIGGIDITGQLSNDPISESLNMLSFRVVDAEYSKSLNLIIAVSSSPSEVRLLNPETLEAPAIPLVIVPTCVSVSPDGHFAAVGHDAWVSYINLLSMEVEQVFPVSTTSLDIVLAGNGYVYVWPLRDQWESIRAINLDSGVETNSGGWSIYAGTLARLHPSGTSIYGADNGLSPSDIEKYDISEGTITVLQDSPYHGDFSMCGNLWISEDGTRIYTKCGNTFRASDVKEEDMTYAGALPDISSIQTLDHSSVNDYVALVPGNSWRDDDDQDQQVHFFDHQFLQTVGTPQELPHYQPDTDFDFPTHGKFAFFNSDGLKVYVLVMVDANAGLLMDNAVVTVQAP